MNLGLEVMTGAVRGGTSILYAGTGETVSERAGVINLGTEGCMLCGALAGYAVAAEVGNAWVGVLAAMVAGGLLASVHAFFVLWRGANQLATGLVTMFLGLGLTSLFGTSYVSKTISPINVWKVPALSSIPWIGDIFFNQDPLVYLSYAMVPIAAWVLFRSRWGVLLRASGERAEVLATYGHPVRAIQATAVIVGGALSGIGGAHLSIAYTDAWFEGMTQGRGFIAAAVVIFAARNPIKVAAGAYLFGAALALSPALQSRGYSINQFALDVVPYVVTLLVLVLLGKRRSAEAPEGLKKVFEIAPTG